MNEFDKMMKADSDKVDIPSNYNNRVDGVLNSLPERDVKPVRRSRIPIIAAVVMAVSLFVVTLSVGKVQSNANFFESFKLTLMDIFHIGTGDNNSEHGNDAEASYQEKADKLGVESRTEEIKAKMDLMMELKETIIDTHGIYVLVQITAPSDIAFNDDISFDYYAFCEGSNYNADNVIGGAISCSFLERRKSSPNVVLYVMELTGDIGQYMGKDISACFKDLTVNPNGDDREVLVEGIWSISFVADSTVREGIEISGDGEISFPYISTTASIMKLEMTPLGLSMTSDVSNMPFDELGVSDTTISLRIRMVDGTEYVLSPYEDSERYIVDSAESEFDQADGISYQKDIYSFSSPIDIDRVLGFYVQDVFVPVQ